jgi:hypothetical protein
MRILMILLPDGADLPSGHRPNLRLERCLGAYFVLRDGGAEVALASPLGGFPPMGPGREDHPDFDLLHRFRDDRTAQDDLTDTLRLDQIWPEDFAAVLCIGAPGQAGALIAAFRDAGKPVAVISGNRDDGGLTITADGADAPLRAARALIGALSPEGGFP